MEEIKGFKVVPAPSKKRQELMSGDDITTSGGCHTKHGKMIGDLTISARTPQEQSEDISFLEDLGIVITSVGEVGSGTCDLNVEMSHAVFEKLNPLWGKFCWSLKEQPSKEVTA